MNKIFIKFSWLAFFLLPGLSRAATSASTAEFLKKLNGYYYCLSQEGLQKYHCEVTCSPDASTATGDDAKLWEAAKSLHFTVDDSNTDATSVQGLAAHSTGDADLDARVGKLQQMLLDSLKTFLESWKSFVMEPLNDPADMAKSNLKFKRTETGFDVIQLDPSGDVLTASFDKKGKILEFVVQQGASKTDIQPEFTNSQKGYLMTGMAFKAAGVEQEFKVEYGVVGGYWLPKVLKVQVNLGAAGAGNVELSFNFDNYRVNQ